MSKLGAAEHLNQQINSTFNELRRLLTVPGCPTLAADALANFDRGFPASLLGKGAGSELSLLCHLASLQAEVAFLLQEPEDQLVRSAHRAFLHLQRLIVADPDVQKKWTTARIEGETACEKLGAAHLLHHGLWAFKANAAGERTDLILGDRLSLSKTDQLAIDGLVLTEWKLASSPTELDRIFQQAVKQSEGYASGSLAGFELRSIRYIVTVGPDVLRIHDDDTKDNVRYVHVHIATSPSTPSLAAKR